MFTLRLPLSCLCLWLLGVAAARAQQRPGTPLPASPNLPAIPGEMPAPTPVPSLINGVNGPRNGGAEPATTRLDFRNSPVGDVLAFYENLSGKHVLAENSVSGSVTLTVAQPVTTTEAIRLIEEILYLNGFNIVPEIGENVVKVIGLGKPPRSFGVPIFFHAEDLPDTSEVVTLVMNLFNLDSQQITGLLTSYVPPNSAISFVAIPNIRSVLITDSARSVRRLAELVARLDQPGAEVAEEFIALQRADATKAVEFLNSVFETKNSGASGGAAAAPNTGNAALPGTNRPRQIRRVDEAGAQVDGAAAVGGVAGTSLGRDTLVVGKVILNADVRTNRVHVVTTEGNMRIVKKLLAEYDSNVAFAAPVRFPLKFLRPDLILPILVQSLQEGEDATKNANTPGATNPNRNGQANSNNSGSNNSFGSLGGLNSGSSFGSSGGLGSGFGSLGSLNSGGTQEIDTTPQEAVVGNNRLIADVANSAIILLGGQDAQEKVAAILSQLDRRSPQVMIHTVIGELSLGNNRELGFQYLLRTRRLGLASNANLFTSNTAGATPVPSASPTTSTGSTSALAALSSLATGLGTSFSGVGGVIAVGRSLDIILAALESTNRFKTISRPMIVTSNFKKATIVSGQTITISTGSVGSLATTGNSTGVYNQLQQELAALQLSVTPQINSDKEVVMEVDQQLNSPLGTASTINGVSNQNLSVRQLHNYVSARNGETIVLGGLITQSDNVSDSNIPYLSRIPVLGNLFRSRTRDANRSELIILMQPEVVDTAGVMRDLREREENKTYLGHELDHQIDPIRVRKAIPVRRPTTTTVTVSGK